MLKAERSYGKLASLKTVPALLSNAFSSPLRFLGFLQMRRVGAQAGGQSGVFLISLYFMV